MSRLAAICAKLTGGALPTSTPFVSPFEAPKVKVEPDFNPNSASHVEKENERSSNGIKTSRTPTPEKPNADEIGVLKRTSLIAGLASGASKRKRQRPTSLAPTETPTKISAQHSFLPTDVSPSTNDDDSMDGSERSLHIDIPDEQAEERDGKSNKNDAFERYKKSLNNNRAASYVSGMYGITGDAMASQSLIALAQKASTANTEMNQNTSGILSPASLSADSLNESAGRTSLKDQLSLSKPKKEMDFVKYMNRYSSAADCKSAQCMAMNYKDHYHCVDCKAKVFVKKEEMIRHYKWHKKRDDSLQHGFMRYSPFDDCTIKFGPCAHNKKQTHYHCVQPGCNKVYVSTSDVQMHANYHRKASAIFLEGFQRFRATEDCGTPNCDFYSQRTTHFHCRRSGCNFTFKNKADMEKHKTYHQKDEILSKDGFKKFMKYEHCPYKGCAYSKLSNHIHCMRPGCFYVLHSTSQLYPHKRKHEKKDLDFSCIKSEAMAAALDMVVPIAFPVKAEPSVPVLSNMAENSSSLSNVPESESSAISGSLSENICNPIIQAENQMNSMDPHSPLTVASSAYSTQDGDAGSIESDDGSSEQICEKSLNLTPGRVLAPAAMNWKTEKSKKLSEHAKSMMGHFKISSSVVGDSCFANSQSNSSTNAELWKKYLTRYTANDPCNARCYLLYKDHYHCNVENCFNAFKNKDAVRDHARLHDNQERISEQLFNTYPFDQACPADGCEFSSKKLHYHCNWTGCKKSIACDDLVFARLNHFQEHELESRISSSNPLNSRRKIASSPDKHLVKRRGRPPKQPNLAYTENQMEPTELRPKDSNQLYAKFDMNALCPDTTCMFRKEEHYHCTKPRCNSVTNRLDVINLHCTNFHNFISIPENYAYFDRNINCKLASCSNNHSSHYHCLRPGCEHSFIRHTTVASHDKKHQETLTLCKSLQSYNKVHILPKPDETSSSKSLTMSMPAQSVETAIADQLRRLAEVAMQNQSTKDSQLLKSNQNSSEQSKVHSSKTIKATGTFFPQKQTSPMDTTHQPYMDESSAMSSSSDESTPNHSEVHADKTSSAGPQLLLNPSNNQATAMLSFLTQVILMQQQQKEGNFAAHQQQQQQTMQQQTVQQQPFAVNNDRWSKLLGRMYASPQVPCGNVFCKKKNVEHYHCLECGTAFNKAHEARLKTHITKHSKFKFFGAQLPSDLPAPDAPMSKQTEAEQNSTGSSVPSSSASLTNMFDALIQNQAPFPASLETNVSESAAFEGGSSSSLPAKLHQVMMQALQLQMVQTGAGNNKPMKSADVSQSESSDDNAASDNETKGYKRYSKGRECGYPKCAHSNSSEHYHCLRDECGFSVADESRLLQHTQRHEKLDKIMGEDFKLFKINSKCGRADCEYTNKAAHFHCLLCPFICTDASRILPHRKHHSENSKGLVESTSSMSVNS